MDKAGHQSEASHVAVPVAYCGSGNSYGTPLHFFIAEGNAVASHGSSANVATAAQHRERQKRAKEEQLKQMSHKERLARFLQKYNPGNLSSIDYILDKYAGKEDQLWVALIKKYGPEPEAGGGPPEPSPLRSSLAVVLCIAEPQHLSGGTSAVAVDQALSPKAAMAARLQTLASLREAASFSIGVHHLETLVYGHVCDMERDNSKRGPHDRHTGTRASEQEQQGIGAPVSPETALHHRDGRAMLHTHAEMVRHVSAIPVVLNSITRVTSGAPASHADGTASSSSAFSRKPHDERHPRVEGGGADDDTVLLNISCVQSGTITCSLPLFTIQAIGVEPVTHSSTPGDADDDRATTEEGDGDPDGVPREHVRPPPPASSTAAFVIVPCRLLDIVRPGPSDDKSTTRMSRGEGGAITPVKRSGADEPVLATVLPDIVLSPSGARRPALHQVPYAITSSRHAEGLASAIIMSDPNAAKSSQSQQKQQFLLACQADGLDPNLVLERRDLLSEKRLLVQDLAAAALRLRQAWQVTEDRHLVCAQEIAQLQERLENHTKPFNLGVPPNTSLAARSATGAAASSSSSAVGSSPAVVSPIRALLGWDPAAFTGGGSASGGHPTSHDQQQFSALHEKTSGLLDASSGNVYPAPQRQARGSTAPGVRPAARRTNLDMIRAE